jgi:hypothetical protein
MSASRYVLDGADVAHRGGQVQDAPAAPEGTGDYLGIPHVAPEQKNISAHPVEVLSVSGRQVVENDDAVAPARGLPYDRGADEAGSSRDRDLPHPSP